LRFDWVRVRQPASTEERRLAVAVNGRIFELLGLEVFRQMAADC
jgi:hypothetical protein